MPRRRFSKGLLLLGTLAPAAVSAAAISTSPTSPSSARLHGTATSHLLSGSAAAHRSVPLHNTSGNSSKNTTPPSSPRTTGTASHATSSRSTTTHSSRSTTSSPTASPLASPTSSGGDNAQDPSCDCWETESGQLFVNHFKTDFSAIDTGTIYTSPSQPPNVTGETGTEGQTSSYFQTADFSNHWYIESWAQKADANEDASYDWVNSPQNVYISRDSPTASTQLTLRTVRFQDFASIAEIDTAQDTLYASIRWHVRVNGATGACAGMSVYGSDQNEADIEILTYDPTNTMHATDHGKGPSATSNVTVAGSWTDFHTWRMDWLPGGVVSYFSGKNMKTNTGNVPANKAIVLANMWSNGGSWSGVMPVGDSAYADFKYIEVAYNTTTSSAKTSCSKVCQMDTYN